MPTIPAMSALGTVVSAPEIYENGLFHPADPPDSLEGMNGALDGANIGSNRPTASNIQVGARSRVYTFGWDMAEFHYAGQVARGADSSLFRLYTGLSTTIFLPFTASALWVLWHGWLQQDATYDAATRYYWDLRTSLDGTELTGCSVPLEWTEPSTGFSGLEERFRFVQRMLMGQTIAPGTRTLDVSAWAKVEDDAATSKLKIYGARVTILALL